MFHRRKSIPDDLATLILAARAIPSPPYHPSPKVFHEGREGSHGYSRGLRSRGAFSYVGFSSSDGSRRSCFLLCSTVLFCECVCASVASCDPLRGSPLAGEEEEEEGKLQKVVVHAQINSLARPAFQVTQKFSIPVPTSAPSSPKYYTRGRLNKKIVYHSSHSLSFTCPVVAKFLNVNQRNIKVTGRRTDKGWRENYNPSHHRHHHPNRKKESCKAGFSKADGIVS